MSDRATFDVTDDDMPDAVLLDAVRAGSSAAYAVLVRRHAGSALRAAGAHGTGPVEPDDLVAEAFERLFVVLRQGGGPRVQCRAYLAVVIRNLAVRRRSLEPRDERYGGPAELGGLIDAGALPGVVPESGCEEIALRHWRGEMVCAAFGALSARWREVLWALDVDGVTPAEVARRMGMSANAVSSLAVRAREGLRRAYLRAQIPDGHEQRCPGTRELLAACVRDDVSPRRATLFMAHVAVCAPCCRLAHGLVETNRELAQESPLVRWLAAG